MVCVKASLEWQMKTAIVSLGWAGATTVTTAVVETATATAATDSGGSGGDSDSGERVVRPVWEELVIKWFGPSGFPQGSKRSV